MLDRHSLRGRGDNVWGERDLRSVLAAGRSSILLVGLLLISLTGLLTVHKYLSLKHRLLTGETSLCHVHMIRHTSQKKDRERFRL